MLPTVKGYYENGKITLKEHPPVSKKTEVIVTFLDEQKDWEKKQRVPGALKGRVTLPDNFNDPIDDLKDYM